MNITTRVTKLDNPESKLKALVYTGATPVALTFDI